MNYFNKTMAAAIIAGAMSLTSCVENEVAPEVKEMRSAQVAYLQAKAALVEAEAQYQAAMASYQEARAADQEASTAIKLADHEVALQHSLMALERAELTHAAAVADLQVKIELAENAAAAEYLKEYSGASDEVFAKSKEKLVLEAEIAEIKILLESDKNDWEIVKLQLERNLAKANAKLVAEEEALAKLQEVAADPASAEEEALALNVEVSELRNANQGLNVEQDKLWLAYMGAWDAYDAALDVIDLYNTKQNDIENAESNLESLNEQIVTQEALIKEEAAELTSLKKVLKDFETALEPYTKALDDAKADVKVKYNTLIEAEAQVEIAQNEYNNDPSTENQTALTEAEEAEATAQTAYDNAIDARNKAQMEYNGPKASRDDAQDDVDAQSNYVDNLNSSLESKKEDVAYWTEYKTNLEADQAAIQTDYDAAVASEVSLYGEALAAYDAYSAVAVKISANDSQISNKLSVISTLENYISSINTAIENKQTDVDDTKGDIHDIEVSLAENRVDKTTAEAELAKLEAELVKLTEDIAAHQALASKYKALLDAALAGN